MNARKFISIALLSIFIYLTSMFSVQASGELTEQLGLITDRSFYSVGETLFFKAELFKNSTPAIESWSNVLYLELITPDGKVLVAEKFRIADRSSSGSLIIPMQLLSGNYYLRAYTKWMRNQSTNSFSFRLLKIINPLSSELLSNADGEDGQPPLIQLPKIEGKHVSIIMDSDSLKTGQTLVFSLNGQTDSPKGVSYSVAVVRKGCSTESYFQLPVDTVSCFPVTYLPETRGVTLSGQVVNKADSVAVPFAKVWLTTKGSFTFTREAMADADGHFNFDLGKHSGMQEVYLHATTSKKSVSPLVLVDTDFAANTHKLPFVPFVIANEETELAQQIIIEAQLNRYFYSSLAQSSDNHRPDSIFFYGKPEKVIRFDQFIEMPTVQDYLSELMPNIKVEDRSQNHVFQFVADHSDLLSEGPLVMLNLRKIENANTVLELSPSEIDRVEIVGQPYIRGEMTYTGIIHFLTKKLDLQKIKYPDGSLFFDYKLLASKTEFVQPKADLTLPKLGNCIFWNPSVFLPEMGFDYEFKIETPSEPGEFEIIVEYFDENQLPCRTSRSFKVF